MVFPIVTILCIGAVALVSGFVLGYRRGGTVRRAFLALSQFVLVSLLLQWIALMPGVANSLLEILFRLQVGCWLGSGVMFLWFSAALLSRPIDAWSIGLTLVGLANAVIVAGTDFVVQGYRAVPGGLIAITHPPLQALSTGIALLPAAVAIAWIERQRRSSHASERRGLLFMSQLAAGISAVLVVLFEFILPWSGLLVDFPHISAIALSISLLTAYSAVRRHTLLEVTLVSTAMPLYERLGDGVIIVDLASRVRWANSAARVLLASDRATLVGKTVDELFNSPIPPSDFSGRLITVGEGGSSRHLSVTQWPNELMGIPLGRVLLVGDVTAQLQAQALARRTHDELEREVELRTTELMAAQRLDAARALSRGVAHVLNNLLAVVLGLGESVRDIAGKMPGISEDIGELLRAVERAKDIVRQIEPSTPDGSGRIAVMLRDLVHQVWRDATLGLPPGVTPHMDLECDGQVLGDPTQLHQVLHNLVKNARESLAGRKGGLSLKLMEAQIVPSADLLSPDLVPGRYARIDISDDGCGIPPGDLEEIFEPLYTTKAADQGTGLGLFNARRIAKEHGGAISARSQLRVGSCFTLWLPLMDQQLPHGPLSSVAFLGGTESVLIVDDEPRVAEATSRLLIPLGYDVTIETDPRKALERLASSNKFDALICDQVMPGMNGTELIAILRSLGNRTPILLLSGTTDASLVEEADQFGVRTVLRKPVSRASLGRVLREELDR
ncbi:MAG: ATP-binding protein [Myxococcota bacterium]|nr:ATP-binding protein [Myxococcota bacterium]